MAKMTELERLVKEQIADDADYIRPEIIESRSIIGIDPRLLDTLTEHVKRKW